MGVALLRFQDRTIYGAGLALEIQSAAKFRIKVWN